MMTCLVVSQAQVHRRVKRFNNLVRLSDLNDSFHLKNTAKPALTRIQDPIFNIMGQTPVLGYAPIIDNDFFDFLRDTYKLPPGM